MHSRPCPPTPPSHTIWLFHRRPVDALITFEPNAVFTVVVMLTCMQRGAGEAGGR